MASAGCGWIEDAMLEAAQKPLTQSKAVLEMSHIHQAFGRPGGGASVVLEDISVSLREGEIVGVLGRSGCGKSTLLRIAAGLMKPSSGGVAFEGALSTGRPRA